MPSRLMLVLRTWGVSEPGRVENLPPKDAAGFSNSSPCPPDMHALICCGPTLHAPRLLRAAPAPARAAPSLKDPHQVLHQVAAADRLALVDRLPRQRQEAVREEGRDECARDANEREPAGNVGGLLRGAGRRRGWGRPGERKGAG
jgi:hypothetical protein